MSSGERVNFYISEYLLDKIKSFPSRGRLSQAGEVLMAIVRMQNATQAATVETKAEDLALRLHLPMKWIQICLDWLVLNRYLGKNANGSYRLLYGVKYPPDKPS